MRAGRPVEHQVGHAEPLGGLQVNHAVRTRWLDTTYFLAASIVRAKDSIQSGLALVRADGRHAASIIS
jgi:hypothetical protein